MALLAWYFHDQDKGFISYPPTSINAVTHAGHERPSVPIATGTPMQVVVLTMSVDLRTVDEYNPEDYPDVVAQGPWPEIWDTFITHVQFNRGRKIT